MKINTTAQIIVSMAVGMALLLFIQLCLALDFGLIVRKPSSESILMEQAYLEMEANPIDYFE